MEISDLSQVTLKLRKLKLYSNVVYLDYCVELKEVIQVKIGKCVLGNVTQETDLERPSTVVF